MNAAQSLHRLGQSIWIDNITRGMLGSGTLRQYIDECAVTGLTSNPTIFDHAIRNSADYDNSIRMKALTGRGGEDLFFELAIEDLTRAADMFRAIHDRSDGVDGWVSLEVSPLIAHDTRKSISMARDLHHRAGRPNVFIKIPGTPEGLPAIEESIFHGVPINVTLLFSREQYLAAAEAYRRGLERRVEAGLSPRVFSVASLFVSRWDVAVAGKTDESLRNRLGIAMAKRTFRAYRELLRGPEWLSLFNRGARPQRLLWASTGMKDPQGDPILYVKELAAPLTVNTMPEATLQALVRAEPFAQALTPDGGDCEDALTRFAAAGIDIDALALELQQDGVKAFSDSWRDLVAVIGDREDKLVA